MTKKGWWRMAAFAVVIGGTVLYLRDPLWLIHLDSGFQSWERNREGRRLRWMGERGSFFVPSNARSVTIPLHAIFLTDDRSPF